MFVSAARLNGGAQCAGHLIRKAKGRPCQDAPITKPISISPKRLPTQSLNFKRGLFADDLRSHIVLRRQLRPLHSREDRDQRALQTAVAQRRRRVSTGCASLREPPSKADRRGSYSDRSCS